MRVGGTSDMMLVVALQLRRGIHYDYYFQRCEELDYRGVLLCSGLRRRNGQHHCLFRRGVHNLRGFCRQTVLKVFRTEGTAKCQLTLWMFVENGTNLITVRRLTWEDQFFLGGENFEAQKFGGRTF